MRVSEKIAEQMIRDKRVAYCYQCYRFILHENKIGPHLIQGHKLVFLSLTIDESYTQKTIEEYMKSLADRIKQLKVKHS